MKFNNLEIYERIYSSHWFLTSYNGVGFVFDFPKIGGGNFIKQVIYLMENQMCRYIFDREEFEKAAHLTANRLINDHKWRAGIYKKIDYYTKHYFLEGEKLRKLKLSELSDNQLIKIIRKIIPLQHFHQVYSVLANGVVLDGRNHLSNKIRDELKRSLGNTHQFEQYWSLLTQPTKMSLRQQKEHQMTILAQNAKKLGKTSLKTSLIDLHKRYCWLDYNNMGPTASIGQFERELKEVNKRVNIKEQLADLKKQQNKLMKKLRFNERSRFLVSLAQGVVWQKGYRKDVQYHSFYCYENLFRELSRRNQISDWQDLSFLFPWEVEQYIRSGHLSVKELQQRRKFSVFTVTRKGLNILMGKQAKQFAKKLGSLENYSGIKEVKGQCAYAGKVRGIVRIVQIPADMAKMNKGEILLSQATSPDLLPAMKIAGAIVTNTGGLICHAAITSRELKIPCVVGTAKATLVFKDGDLVEVDANRGVVRKIK